MATEADKVNDGALATLVAVGTFSMIGICAFVTALVRHEVSSEVDRKDVAADREFRDVAADQRAKLNAPPGWVDRGKGLVSLPIDRAKELVVEDLARDPNTATPPPPQPLDAGVTPAANVPEAGAETTEAGAPEPGQEPAPGPETGLVQDKPVPEQPAEKKAEVKPAPAPKPVAPAPAPAAPAAPTPAPAAPASVATP